MSSINRRWGGRGSADVNIYTAWWVGGYIIISWKVSSIFWKIPSFKNSFSYSVRRTNRWNKGANWYSKGWTESSDKKLRVEPRLEPGTFLLTQSRSRYQHTNGWYCWRHGSTDFHLTMLIKSIFLFCNRTISPDTYEEQTCGYC